MTLEKAQQIKKICDKIAETEQKIKDLEDCSYVDINIVFPFEASKPLKIYKKSRIHKYIIQAYKEDRDALISELNDID